MGLLNTISRGNASRTASRPTGIKLLEQLCDENDWSIDARHGAGVALHFRGDSVTPERTVIAIAPEGDRRVGLTAVCRAKFTADMMPKQVMPCLLMRNEEVIVGGWACEEEDGVFSFKLKYTALAATLDAEAFKYICAAMIQEVAEIEAEMHERGVL